MRLKLYCSGREVVLNRPIMLAAWPGMGNVAISAIDYLRKKLNAKPLGEIDFSEFVAPEASHVENGIAVLSKIPKIVIYYRKYPDLIIVEGETQLHGKLGAILMEKIIRLVGKRFNVSKIFTGAAFPVPISYEEPSTLYTAATTLSLRDLLFNEYQVKILDHGEISGFNGLLLGYAREIGIPSACILATIPLYAMNLPNPKASREIVKILANILRVRIPLTDLDLQVKLMEKEMIEIEDRMKEELVLSPKDDASGETPLFVKQKIERLFREARNNRQKAYKLKKELDKWNLFDSYEDRFLDLFKKQ